MKDMTETARLPPPRPSSRWGLVGIVLALLALRILGFVLIAFLVVSIALLVIWIGLPLLLAMLWRRSAASPECIGGWPAGCWAR